MASQTFIRFELPLFIALLRDNLIRYLLDLANIVLYRLLKQQSSAVDFKIQ